MCFRDRFPSIWPGRVQLRPVGAWVRGAGLTGSFARTPRRCVAFELDLREGKWDPVHLLPAEAEVRSADHCLWKGQGRDTRPCVASGRRHPVGAFEWAVSSPPPALLM